MTNHSTGAPARRAEQIENQEILEKLRELQEYGFGRLEVVVRDHEVSTLHWQKSMVKGARRD